MQLTFIHPAFLWLLLVVPLVPALALVAPRRLPAPRFWTSLVLRIIVLLSLILALAGAQVVRAVGATTTIFLLDGSDSIALSQRARAEAFIQQAIANMPSQDRAGVVVFGQKALVERTASSDTTFGQVTARPAGSATNLDEALQLGLAMLPGEGHQRLVLLSDGGENAGDALARARVLAERGMPVDIVPLSGLADGMDAQVSRVSVPATARAGQALRMAITLESNMPSQGRLRVEGPNGQVIADQQIELPQGSRDLELKLPEPQQAFNRYTVRLEVANDARPENNAAEAYTFVSGRPRVLLVEGAPGEAQNLANALKAASIEADAVSPDRMPSSIGALSAYDAVALVNVPERAVPKHLQSALAAYVHDLGRGLLMVGGTQSFGAGSWRKTPIEAALPVDMDIPTQYQLPDASIVVLIDTSGSMSEEEGGRTKLQLAADGAAKIASLLRDEDEITVIPFDSATGRVVGPMPGKQRDEAISALGKIEPGGSGINFRDGMLAAERYVNQSTKPVRHVITITDGNDTKQHEGALDIIKRLRDQRVTVTSVAIGDGADVPFLRESANAGSGRFFLTQRASEIPSILADDAQAVIRSYVNEEPFTPVQAALHPILRTLDRVPALKGHVVTSAKSTAQVLLATPRGEPVLATWQYGLGRSAAWTSDMGERWAADWAAWQQFPAFAAQLTGWLLPMPNSQLLSINSQAVNGQLVLDVQAQDNAGRVRPGLNVHGQLVRGDGTNVPVQLREVGPGAYRAAVTSAPPGAYLVQLVAEDGQRNLVGAVTAGAVVPQSAEYRARGNNPGLLAALAHTTGGRENIQPSAAFDPNQTSGGAVSEIGMWLLMLALLLLPFDVAVRRLFGRGRQHTLERTVQRQPWWQEASAAFQAKLNVETQHAKQPSVSRKPSQREAELERLREAQERARKRARGEEV